MMGFLLLFLLRYRHGGGGAPAATGMAAGVFLRFLASFLLGLPRFRLLFVLFCAKLSLEVIMV